MHASTQSLPVFTEPLRRIEARNGESCECCGYPFDGGDVAYQGRDSERVVCSKGCMTRERFIVTAGMTDGRARYCFGCDESTYRWLGFELPCLRQEYDAIVESLKTLPAAAAVA